jgi:hypothetical protein
MSLFIPTIPQANDNLDFSQGQLLSNNSGLDTVFGIDHYKFSDATVNKGFHNHVTTPAIIGGEPTTAANLPLLYGLTVPGNLGVIQFSKGQNIASTFPGSPLASIQSPLAATTVAAFPATTPVFDFTGLNKALSLLIVLDSSTQSSLFAYVAWTGAALVIVDLITPFNLKTVAVDNVLSIQNISGAPKTTIYWTLEFLRVQ